MAVNRQVFVPGGIGYDESGGRRQTFVPGYVGYDETTEWATGWFEVRLQEADDPFSCENHLIDIRMQAFRDGVLFEYKLVQGTTELDYWFESLDIADGLVERSHLLSRSVADLITNYADVRVRGRVRIP